METQYFGKPVSLLIGLGYQINHKTIGAIRTTEDTKFQELFFVKTRVSLVVVKVQDI